MYRPTTFCFYSSNPKRFAPIKSGFFPEFCFVQMQSVYKQCLLEPPNKNQNVSDRRTDIRTDRQRENSKPLPAQIQFAGGGDRGNIHPKLRRTVKYVDSVKCYLTNYWFGQMLCFVIVTYQTYGKYTNCCVK